MPEPISFQRGVPDEEALDHVTDAVAHALSRPLRRSRGRVLQYGAQQGEESLLAAIATRNKRTTTDRVFACGGSLQLFDLLTQVLTTGGKLLVITENPSYDRALSTLKRHGVKVIGVPLGRAGLDLHRLEREIKTHKPDFIYVIPDFQNPSGQTMSLEVRLALVGFAQKYKFFIIEDIPYRLLRYAGEDLPTLRELDESDEWVISISSFSKLIGPSLRVGYAIGPPQVIAALKALGEATYLCPDRVSQAGIAELLQDGWLDGQVKYLRGLYGPRLLTAQTASAKLLPEGTFVIPTEGGFFLTLILPTKANTTDLIPRAADQGLLLSNLGGFCVPGTKGGINPQRTVRIPFCSLTEGDIIRGLTILGQLTKPV